MNEENQGVTRSSAGRSAALRAEPASAVSGLRPAATNAGDKWTQDEAIALCRQIEAVCPDAGCHVALTGGTLYKDGPRKDLDLLFYRIRQVDEIDMAMLWELLAGIGIRKVSGFGWCHKAKHEDRAIDCFFPEEGDGEYAQGDSDFELDPDMLRELAAEKVL